MKINILVLMALCLAGCSTEMILDFKKVSPGPGVDGFFIKPMQFSSNCNDVKIGRSYCYIDSSLVKDGRVSIIYVPYRMHSTADNKCGSEYKNDIEGFRRCTERMSDQYVAIVGKNLLELMNTPSAGSGELVLNINELMAKYKNAMPKGEHSWFNWKKRVVLEMSKTEDRKMIYRGEVYWRSAPSTSHNPWQ